MSYRIFDIRDAEPLGPDDDRVIELVFTHVFDEKSSCGNVERVSMKMLKEIRDKADDYIKANDDG